MISEKVLIEGCIREELSVQKALYEHFSGRMLVVCLRYAKDRMDAEEILQEGFLKVFENIGRFRRECPLEGWVRRIMVNTALKHYRKKSHLYPVVDIEEAEHITDNDMIEDKKYDMETLLKIIHELAPRYKMVFNLFAVEGLSHKEISAMLKIPENTSKSHYARAKTMLLNKIKETDKLNSQRYV